MTVRLINPSGRAVTLFIRGAKSANAAIRTAQTLHGTDYRPMWALPGDAR